MGSQDTKKHGKTMNQNQQSNKGFASSDRQRDSDISKQSGQESTSGSRRESPNANSNVGREESSKANKQNR
ncbi:MAG: hypothetical protein JSU04_07645 [Bdellovibrionales bacterium]|nr:hypothetical protein [Bdellovibrionales bacterium]